MWSKPNIGGNTRSRAQHGRGLSVNKRDDQEEGLESHSINIVDFDSFSKVLNRPGGFRDPGEPEEYCRGFQVFDKEMTGFIGVGQLRYSECSMACQSWRSTDLGV